MSARTSAPLRLVLCPTLALLRSGPPEIQRNTLDAVAQMGWRRTIVEDMAEMTSATAAMHLITNHAMASIHFGFDRIGQWIVETWPTCPALEFHLGDEQRLIAGSAAKGARAFFVQQRATSRHLGSVLAHDFILLGRQQLAPFRFGMSNRILLRHVQRSRDCRHLIASGFTGEPTAPVIGMAGATNRNSYTLSRSQSSASSFRLKISPIVIPMMGMVIQCQGWLIPSSLSFGRTSQPQVSLASAASCVSLTKSSVSNANPGASPPGYPSQLPMRWHRSIIPVLTMT